MTSCCDRNYPMSITGDCRNPVLSEAFSREGVGAEPVKSYASGLIAGRDADSQEFCPNCSQGKMVDGQCNWCSWEPE